MAGPYDQSHNERPRNSFGEHLARPFKRTVDVIRNRVDDLVALANRPAFLDQYPSKAVPFYFSKLWGPIPLTAARRYTGVGFEALAPVVNLGAYLLPRNGNIFVNREGAWHWTATNIKGYYSLTYDADPGFGATTFINTLPVSDIFNNAIETNGGALCENYFFSHVSYEIRPNISFDLKLYDKKRARFLHDDVLPPQTLCAQGFANKRVASPARFDPNTEIEPRLRVLEVRPGSLLDTTTAYNAAQFAAYIAIVFKGYKVLSV